MSKNDTWQQAPAQLAMPMEGELHVWHATLDLGEHFVAWSREQCAEEERERAARFVFERDRRHFLISRGLLRGLLARYLGYKPAQIQLRADRYGKLHLANPAPAPMQFNISHSHGGWLLAVTVERPVGVDLEWERPDLDYRSLVPSVFSTHERAQLASLPPQLGRSGFFAGWSRKEAWIKALGHGLSHALDSFDVDLDPRREGGLLATRPDPQEAAKWSLRALPELSGYRAAIAVAGGISTLATWQVDSSALWSLE